MKALRALITTTALLALIVSFQNCSVRRAAGVDGSSGGLSSYNPANGAVPGSTAGTITNGGTVTATCMVRPETQGTVTGITTPPAIKSTFALATRYSSTAFSSSTLSLTASSECYKKSDLTTPYQCSATTAAPACVSKSTYTVSISLVCSTTSSTVTDCTNFTSKIGQEVAMTDALSNSLSISVTRSTDSCVATASTTYLPNFSNKVGRFKVISAQGLGGGSAQSVVSVQLIGVQLVKGGTDTTSSITVDGTYAGEVVTLPACTP